MVPSKISVEGKEHEHKSRTDVWQESSEQDSEKNALLNEESTEEELEQNETETDDGRPRIHVGSSKCMYKGCSKCVPNPRKLVCDKDERLNNWKKKYKKAPDTFSVKQQGGNICVTRTDLTK